MKTTANLQDLKNAQLAAIAILASLTGGEQAPDVVEARRAELVAMKKDELVDLILGLEKPKAAREAKVEPLVRAILESPECAALNYEQIAGLVQDVLPDSKTSSKSVASYASKHKADWAVVARVRVKVNPLEFIGSIATA